jgi:SAM-dependent methyltransferase
MNITWEDAVVWLKQQPEQIGLVRSCFFDDPLTEAAERYYQSTEWQAVQRMLPRTPGKALDLGAGRGISSYALAKDGWDTTALEPDKSKIVGAGAIRSLASDAGLKIEVIERWGEKLPFADGTFDVVHGRQVLHHAKDLKQLCSEIGRVLKKGSFFIATREHVISKRGDLDSFLKSHPLHKLYGGENAYLLDEYLSAINQAGIRLTHILNPFQSDINLFPETIDSLKVMIAKKMKFPFARLIPYSLIGLAGGIYNVPGRLYTFAGVKDK